LSTIRGADHVVVMDEGRVVEEGRPVDLLRSSGLFARLYGGQDAGANGQAAARDSAVESR
jgi:ABC-type multidrug transport system fused ATPase/permease subunit